MSKIDVLQYYVIIWGIHDMIFSETTNLTVNNS